MIMTPQWVSFYKTSRRERKRAVMNLKLLWERYKASHRVRLVTPLQAEVPVAVRGPKPFRSLTHDESLAILEDAIEWLVDEAKTTLAMPNGPGKNRLRAELRGRHESMIRDFARLVREQED
jgi:hypothetical protein